MRRGAGRDDDVPPIPEIPEFLRGRSYLNFEESATGSRSFYDEVTDRHLRRIKTQVDPGDIFMSNHPIAPTETLTDAPSTTR